jgi:hypothetical protein
MLDRVGWRVVSAFLELAVGSVQYAFIIQFDLLPS